MKCQNCGAENEDNAKFCSECGAKLEEPQKYACPNCGKIVKENAKFCNECGQELVWPDADLTKIPHPIKNNKVEQKQSSNNHSSTPNPKLARICDLIVACLMALAALFFIVGAFGDLYVAKVSGIASQSMTIKYFFGDGAKGLDAYKNMGGYEDSIANYYYGFRVGTIVCESIVFFVNVIASIGLSVLTFINIYNIFAKKRRPNLNALFGNALTGLLYIVLVISHYIVINELASVSLGWGPILIIVALFILFAAFVAKQVADCALNTTKKNVVNASLSALSLLVLLLACVVTMNVQVSSANTPDASVNGYALLLYALEQYSSSGEAPEELGRYIIGFILTIFGAILFILKIFVMEKDKKNNVIDPILTLLGGTLYIVGSILFIVNDMSSEIAGQVIGFIILMVVGLALPVCKLLVDEKASD